MTSPASFENVREKWFPEVHHHCPGVPCLIVGTQTDLRDEQSVKDKLAKQRMQPVRKEDGERMAKDLGAVKYVECSALTQYKLKDVFDEVSEVPQSHFRLQCIHPLVLDWAPNTPDFFGSILTLFVGGKVLLRYKADNPPAGDSGGPGATTPKEKGPQMCHSMTKLSKSVKNANCCVIL